MPKRTNTYRDHPDVTARTREILSQGHWYEDGPPHWCIGKAQHPARTADEAEVQRLKLVKLLRRYAADHPGADVLAVRLDTCTPGQRCMSGACPECSRAYTRWFVSSASALLKSLQGSISALSLVHADHSVPVGKLTPGCVQLAKKKVRTILMRTGITTGVGGIDLSANEDEDDAFAPYYQVQWWLLAPTREVNSADRQLRKLFRRTETTPRPVKIQIWDGDLAALAYALKSEFDRRVSIICEGKSGTRKPHRNTRDRKLRVEQQVELMIAFDQVGLHSRLHLGGCRVVNTINGPMIRMIKSKPGRCQQ